MLLRSTGKVKRGLGTIRQDVNVSIEEGARVEIKGVQSLDDIDDIVRNEVARQAELVAIRDELSELEASVGDVRDVTEVFEGTESGVIGGALNSGGSVMAVPLYGFDGIVGREIAPDRRLGTEFSDHARHGAGGIFHTDELPAYGVTEDEVAALRDAVGARSEDAVAIVAADTEIAESAIDAVRWSGREPRSRAFPRRPAVRTTTGRPDTCGRSRGPRGCIPRQTCRPSNRTRATFRNRIADSKGRALPGRVRARRGAG